MALIKRFEDLKAWKDSRELVFTIYKSTQRSPFSSDWGLKDQLQRAVVSIMSNIAEGFERGSNREFVQFLYIAKASAGEVRSLLYVALDQKYLAKNEFDALHDAADAVSRQLKGFIAYLQSSSMKTRNKLEK